MGLSLGKCGTQTKKANFSLLAEARQGNPWLHKHAKFTRPAKLPLLLNQLWNFYIFWHLYYSKLLPNILFLLSSYFSVRFAMGWDTVTCRYSLLR